MDKISKSSQNVELKNLEYDEDISEAPIQKENINKQNKYNIKLRTYLILFLILNCMILIGYFYSFKKPSNFPGKQKENMIRKLQEKKYNNSYSNNSFQFNITNSTEHYSETEKELYMSTNYISTTGLETTVAIDHTSIPEIITDINYLTQTGFIKDINYTNYISITEALHITDKNKENEPDSITDINFNIKTHIKSEYNTQFSHEIDKENKEENETDCNARDFFDNLCVPNIKNNETNLDYVSYLLNEIDKGSLNNIFDSAIKENKQFLAFENDITYQISTTSNQNTSNISIINLDECESELKRIYGINSNEKLIIFKLEYSIEGIKIPIIEYSLFTRDGVQLNLSYCSEIPILYSIPVSINEEKEFIYNPNSDFYQDECVPYSTNDDTDMTIFDRKNYFNNNNLSLCEESCVYKGYNNYIKRVECECNTKIIFPYLIKNKEYKNKLIKGFKDFDKGSNIFVIFCYKLFFSKEGMNENILNYLMIIFIFIVIMLLIFFWLKGFSLYKKRISDAISLKYCSIKEENNQNQNQIIQVKKKIKNENRYNTSQPKFTNDEIDSKKNIENSKSNYKNNPQLKIEDLSCDKAIDKKEKEKNNGKDDLKLFDNDYEINYLNYSQALEYDKRTFCEYYWSLIKTKQLLLFTFVVKNDYNSKIIKLCLFIFSFSLFLTVNALFYNESLIHKIYLDNGSYIFKYHLPQIIYSTIICSVIKVIITQLSLTEKKVANIKKSKSFELAIRKTEEVLKFLKKKFIIFFVLNIILLLLFWYYLGCFCAVFKNTQVSLIKDTSISFAAALIYPVFIALIPCAMRINALRAKNKDKEYLYKASLICQLF